MAQPPIAAQRQPPPNRLSIAHLLLWTATTAAVLAGTQRLWHSRLPLLSPDSVPAIQSPFQRMQRLESRLSSLALAFPLSVRFALPGGVVLVAARLLPASDWRFSFDELGGGLVGLGLAIYLDSRFGGAYGPVIAVPIGLIPAILMALGKLTIGLAVAEDVQSQARRDVFHWAGLAAWLLLMLHFVLGLIVGDVA